MYKNMDYKDTYCCPSGANIRYPSNAKDSIKGWAYIFTQDNEYVNDLQVYYLVQVRTGDGWVGYTGYLPTHDQIDEFNTNVSL